MLKRKPGEFDMALKFTAIETQISKIAGAIYGRQIFAIFSPEDDRGINEYSAFESYTAEGVSGSIFQVALPRRAQAVRQNLLEAFSQARLSSFFCGKARLINRKFEGLWESRAYRLYDEQGCMGFLFFRGESDSVNFD